MSVPETMELVSVVSVVTSDKFSVPRLWRACQRSLLLVLRCNERQERGVCAGDHAGVVAVLSLAATMELVSVGTSDKCLCADYGAPASALSFSPCVATRARLSVPKTMPELLLSDERVRR